MAALRTGFLPLVDCAPLIVAHELGFAEAEGIRLELVREQSWSNLRDRLAIGALDASHLLAPLAVAMSLGLSGLRVPMTAALLLNRGGNTICLSGALDARLGGEIGPGSDPAVLASALFDRASRPLRVAVPYFHSCHHLLLHQWLTGAGFDAREIELKITPPPYMIDAMTAGEVDAFVVGEPWGSLAVERSVAVMALPTVLLARDAPEKVLAVTRAFATTREDEGQALVRAVSAAARWCDQPRNHALLAELLSRRDYVDVSAEIIGRSLSGWLTRDRRGSQAHYPGFVDFHGQAGNRPQPSHAAWLHRGLMAQGQVGPGDAEEAGRVFDGRLFDAAAVPVSAD
jgi:NitT/TauT family transport system ATP-binding protein